MKANVGAVHSSRFFSKGEVSPQFKMLRIPGLEHSSQSLLILITFLISMHLT